MLLPLFTCVGFMLAVLYIDLHFDISALAFRKNKASVPKEVLDSISSYYKRVTSNPWLLVFVMTTTVICVVWEIVYELVPPRVGYGSLILFAILMVIGMVKVIPAAQRLGSGKAGDEERIKLVHSLFPYHMIFLVIIATLTLLHLSTIER